MGHGPSISALAERDAEFRKYLDQIRGELEKDKEKDKETLEAEVDKYYAKGGWKYSPLMAGEQFDVQQMTAWSLDNVKKILNSVRDAIFGSAAPPEGIEVQKPDALEQSMKYLQELNLLALTRAFSLVQGVLETFATDTSFRGQSIIKVDVVAPGMTLFVSIRSNVWKSKSFFQNSAIAQYLYVMRSYFSVEQAGDISKYNDLLAYENIKQAYRTRMAALAEKIGDPNTPYSSLGELDEELGYYAENLANLQATIEELTKSEARRHLESARSALSHRRAKESLET